MELLGIGYSELFTFFIAALIIVVAPGPDRVFILTRSISGGKRVGVFTALGIQLGVVFHIFLATIGVSSILMASALAFKIVKYIGAVYLIFLGIKTFRERSNINFNLTSEDGSAKNSFWQGAITNIFNPKVALFFLTFLPQFINTSEGNTIVQFLFLGCIFAVLGLFTS